MNANKHGKRMVRVNTIADKLENVKKQKKFSNNNKSLFNLTLLNQISAHNATSPKDQADDKSDSNFSSHFEAQT